MDNQYILRRGKHSDIDPLSQLYQRTFRETYVEDLFIPHPEKDLDSFFRSSASPEGFAQNLKNLQQAIWVIENKTNGELIAFTLVGSCDAHKIPRPDVCSNEDAALYRLYVKQDQRSYGFGQQLMNVVLPWIEEHYPKRPIWLAVMAKNFKAQKFYTHYGFRKVGDFDFAVGEWRNHNFIMKREPILPS